MKLYSTRNLNEIKNPKDAIIKGLSDDGGLYCPKYEDIVAHKFDIWKLLSNNYKATAKLVFSIFLDDFTDAEIENCINLAYNKNNFDVNTWKIKGTVIIIVKNSSFFAKLIIA